MGTFWCTLFFFTINPLVTRSPFGWKLCNADFNLQYYPSLGETKPVMPNDFEMIKLVRANPITQAIFFRIILNCSVQLLVVSPALISILKMLMRMENQ